LKINEESKIVSTIVSISGVLTYFTLLILVYRIDNTSVSLVLSKAIILLPINIFCLYILFKNTSFSDISFNGISVMFKYSIFLMPYALSGFLLQQFDRVMLSQLGNLADVAYYSFAYSIGSLPYIIVSVILVSWNPSFMRLCNENKFNNLNRQSKLLLIISSCII
ncbi:TPA: oligosaccharide flippase family protein, partial [Vibrio cholerae]|nr:oligosaccharide flippase family protein [Vibrio cholerae]